MSRPLRYQPKEWSIFFVTADVSKAFKGAKVLPSKVPHEFFMQHGGALSDRHHPEHVFESLLSKAFKGAFKGATRVFCAT